MKIFQPFNTRRELIQYLNEYLGEKYVTFVKNKQRTNIKNGDMANHNWVFFGKPNPIEARVFTEEFKALVLSFYEEVNVSLYDDSIALSTSRWLEMIRECAAKGIKMTRERQAMQHDELAISASKSTVTQHVTIDFITNLLEAKGQDRSLYSDEELALLRAYEGAGGQGAEGEEMLSQFFTPGYVCEIMWKLAKYFGWSGGKVLEPSLGTGRFWEHAPEHAQLVGLEPNEVAANIAKLLYPHATVLDLYFEQAFLQPKTATVSKEFASKYTSGSYEGYPYPASKESWLGRFGLVIGNPPYGKFQNMYSGYFKPLKIAQIEHFFILKSLELLETGGLLILLIPSNFMRNGMTYQSIKERIFQKAVLLACFRLPNGKDTFQNTGVGGDILVLKKK